jgi:hypothetical protein
MTDGNFGHQVEHVDQQVVQRSKQRVQQDAPCQGTDDFGHDVRQQHDAAEHRAPPRQVVQQQGNAHTHRELEDLRPERKADGGHDGPTEQVVGPEIHVVLKADKGALAHAHDIEKAEPERTHERVADQAEQQDGRR